MNNLNSSFKEFKDFWEEFKTRLFFDGGEELSLIVRSIFEYFKNWPFLVDKEEGNEVFMSELAFFCLEIKQKNNIYKQVYEKLDKIIVSKTESRKVVKTTEGGIKATSEYNNSYFNNPDNFLGYSERIEHSPEIKISEGIPIEKEDGTIEILPNYTKTQDPSVLGRILNSFPDVRADFEKLKNRFKKTGIFMNIFSPEGEWVVNEETGERILKKNKIKFIKDFEDDDEDESDEDKEITKPSKKNIYIDDINEFEYNKLKKTIPNSVEVNYQAERLTRRKRYLQNQIKKTISTFKDKLILRKEHTESLIEAFKKDVIFPNIGDDSKKLPVIASYEEYSKAPYWARINQVVGYNEIKSNLADFVENYNSLLQDNIEIPNQMFLLIGRPGVGKTFIAESFARACNLPSVTINLNGKKEPSLLFGIPQEYAGARVGDILQTMITYKNKSPVIIFDEIDKCDRQVQRVIGNITDTTVNKNFKDVFFDYPVDISKLIIFCIANYTEDVEGFLANRLNIFSVKPLNFNERMEVVQDLIDLEFKHYKIEHLKNNINFELKKKFLTWEWGIRGTKSNVEKFALRVYSLNKKNQLPNNWDEYEWPIVKRIELDEGDSYKGREACPVYLDYDAEHLKKCECFKPKEIEGWITNMGESY